VRHQTPSHEDDLALSRLFVIADDGLKGAGCDVVISPFEHEFREIATNTEVLGDLLFVRTSEVATAHYFLALLSVFPRIVLCGSVVDLGYPLAIRKFCACMLATFFARVCLHQSYFIMSPISVCENGFGVFAEKTSQAFGHTGSVPLRVAAHELSCKFQTYRMGL
jgi:hypothetical protein